MEAQEDQYPITIINQVITKFHMRPVKEEIIMWIMINRMVKGRMFIIKVRGTIIIATTIEVTIILEVAGDKIGEEDEEEGKREGKRGWPWPKPLKVVAPVVFLALAPTSFNFT